MQIVVTKAHTLDQSTTEYFSQFWGLKVLDVNASVAGFW